MLIKHKKKELRKQMLSNRAKLDLAVKKQYDQWICQSVWDIINTRNVRYLHCFLPMGAEINIFPLIEKVLATQKKVITPKTLPRGKLQNLILKSLDEIEEGVFGTSHPSNAIEFSGAYDLIIVPGLAFDNSNFRLGYGGGYYDQFLTQNSDAYKLGICYPFQKINEVPSEPHDVQLDAILYPDF